MILIGTMDWAGTSGRGHFLCPNCETKQPYRLRDTRPFLTLYFIPIIPLGGITQTVQCGQCREHFETVVLSDQATRTSASPDTGESKSVPDVTFEQDLLNVMALVMIEDGQITENEISIARRLYSNITDSNLTREELGRTCSMMKVHRMNPQNYLVTAVSRRSHQERLLIVQAMFGVSGADGEISAGRMKSLLKAHQLMGLDEREFKTAVQATSQWLT